MPSPTILEAFAVAAPGLAPFVAEELRELGITPGEASDAGVSFPASHGELYRANLNTRIASRILVRLGAFRAAHFSELEKGSRGIDWAAWIPAGAVLALRVTCRKSRLYHSGAVAERLAGVIAAQVRGVQWDRAVGDDDEDRPGTLVVVRIDRDDCTLSIDSSGDLLHRRGYRQAIARAPMRETLAAAMLRASRWTGATPLVDPMCGSGTLVIEGALVARHIPAGAGRRFGFQQWPSFNAAAWKEVQRTAAGDAPPGGRVALRGSDRDAGAVEAARANAERAAVHDDVEFECLPLSAVRPPGGAAGLLLTNPPWGERIGESGELRDLYAALGRLARGPFAGWRVGILTTSEQLRKASGLPLQPVFETSAGGQRVTFSLTP